jgi:plasmid stabilization system protein ParE
MKYRVHELALAQADVRTIVQWLAQRSPQGAEAWLDAYDQMIEGLTRFVGHGVAPESKSTDFRVQQVFFKTRYGHMYRAIYYVEDENVFILRVRGKGQAMVRGDELGKS